MEIQEDWVTSANQMKTKPECSLNQKNTLVSKTISQLKMGLEKIHDPLNEVQKQLILREKECERLQKEVSNLK